LTEKRWRHSCYNADWVKKGTVPDTNLYFGVGAFGMGFIAYHLSVWIFFVAKMRNKLTLNIKNINFVN
jgi:hypothetical protein